MQGMNLVVIHKELLDIACLHVTGGIGSFNALVQVGGLGIVKRRFGTRIKLEVLMTKLRGLALSVSHYLILLCMGWHYLIDSSIRNLLLVTRSSALSLVLLSSSLIKSDTSSHNACVSFQVFLTLVNRYAVVLYPLINYPYIFRIILCVLHAVALCVL
jgi:hypothetical protein